MFDKKLFDRIDGHLEEPNGIGLYHVASGHYDHRVAYGFLRLTVEHAYGDGALSGWLGKSVQTNTNQ
jgi:hypothetical protein